MGLELKPSMTHLGQMSILHLVYKLIAKVKEIKVDQNSTKPPQKHEKEYKSMALHPHN